MIEKENEEQKIKELETEQEVSEFALSLKKKMNIYFDKNNFRANVLAGDIVFDNFDSITFKGDNRGYFVINDEDSDIYRYKDGVYKIDGERKIRAIARLVMGDKATNHYVNEVVSAVKDFIGLRIDINKLNNYSNLINLSNGIYDMASEQIIPHDKKYFFTTKLPIKYDHNAKCPRAIQFFNEVHKQDDIPIIQELFGYCFYPRYDYHYIFFFIGGGRNGKGTELNLLIALIGQDNITSDSPHSLTEDIFAPAHLFGKNADICGDIGTKTIVNSEILKKASGGDLIEAQRKFGHGFRFINFAKLIYATNEPPEIQDRTDAMWDRMVHITFPNVFKKGAKETDPSLIEKLTTPEELSGIFNWAMIGLKRLKENGKMSYSKTTEENMLQYDRKANPALAYSQDTLNYNEGAWIFKEVLLSEINKWCKQHKEREISANHLTKKICSAIPSCYPDRISLDGKQRQVYMNISFKELTEQKKSTVMEHSQKKLNVELSQEDKINNILTCIEMNNAEGKEVTTGDLIENGFKLEFIEKCIEQKIIFIKPNGFIAIGV